MAAQQRISIAFVDDPGVREVPLPGAAARGSEAGLGLHLRGALARDAGLIGGRVGNEVAIGCYTRAPNAHTLSRRAGVPVIGGNGDACFPLADQSAGVTGAAADGTRGVVVGHGAIGNTHQPAEVIAIGRPWGRGGRGDDVARGVAVSHGHIGDGNTHQAAGNSKSPAEVARGVAAGHVVEGAADQAAN